MKRVLNFKGAMTLLMLVCTMMAFTSMSTLPAENPVGTWNYEVETEDGTMTGTVVVSKEEGGFAVLVTTQVFGDLELEDIEFKDSSMTASTEVEGDTVEFEFEFDGDTMEGMVYVGDEEYSMTAEREKK